jgi:hypothetical protein
MIKILKQVSNIKGHAGFTLVELWIATGLILLSTAMSLMIQQHALRIIHATRDYQHALIVGLSVRSLFTNLFEKRVLVPKRVIDQTTHPLIQGDLGALLQASPLRSYPSTACARLIIKPSICRYLDPDSDIVEVIRYRLEETERMIRWVQMPSDFYMILQGKSLVKSDGLYHWQAGGVLSEWITGVRALRLASVVRTSASSSLLETFCAIVEFKIAFDAQYFTESDLIRVAMPCTQVGGAG